MSQKEFDEDDEVETVVIGDSEFHLVSGREPPDAPKKGRGRHEQVSDEAHESRAGVQDHGRQA